MVHCTQEEFIELCATVNNMNPTYPGNFRRAMEEFDKYVWRVQWGSSNWDRHCS